VIMLFVASALATAVPQQGGWPCSRMNWAWRNVYITCGINQYAPGSGVVAGSAGAYFAGTLNAPVTSTQGTPLGLFSLGASTSAASAYVFQPAMSGPNDAGGPNLCATGPSTGGQLYRDRCRRMMDIYGNLVWLCANPSKSHASPSATIGPDYTPAAFQAPHGTNAANLKAAVAWCITPIANNFPTPTNVCPGLAGWWNVVWNACSIYDSTRNGVAPNGPVGIPNFVLHGTGGAAVGIVPNDATLVVQPLTLCGAAATPSAANWNVHGPAGNFNTRCRRAIDQFGRSSSRCNSGAALGTPVTPTVGSADPLHFLAANLGSYQPNCNA